MWPPPLLRLPRSSSGRGRRAWRVAGGRDADVPGVRPGLALKASSLIWLSDFIGLPPRRCAYLAFDVKLRGHAATSQVGVGDPGPRPPGGTPPSTPEPCTSGAKAATGPGPKVRLARNGCPRHPRWSAGTLPPICVGREHDTGRSALAGSWTRALAERVMRPSEPLVHTCLRIPKFGAASAHVTALAAARTQ
jgi:hypothetical protein